MKDYDIVYCGNERKIERLVFSIESILRNIRVKNNINFHILDFNISQASKDRLCAMVNKYKVLNTDKTASGADSICGDSIAPQYSISFHGHKLGRANKQKMNFYIDNYNSIARGSQQLHRLFLQDIFSELDSCLFLSPNVMAKQCIGKVVDTLNFDGRFAVVSDNKATHKVFSEDLFIHINNEIEIKNFCKYFNRKIYFNPDIMLLNLKQMREKEIAQQFYAYALYYLHSPYKGYINSADGLLRLGFEDYIKVSSF